LWEEPMAQPTPNKEYLSRSEVAELFSVSPNTVTRWAEAGKLPCVRTLGGHRRYEADRMYQLAQQMVNQEDDMEELRLHLPNMYGDHHVLHVKQLLQQLEGVEDVMASAAFQEVAVTFDPAVTSAADIASALAAQGYPVGTHNGPVHVGLKADAVPRHAVGWALDSAVTAGDSAKWKLPDWHSAGPLPCPGFEYRNVGSSHPADD
jgi:excisionase family DNA binding protein